MAPPRPPAVSKTMLKGIFQSAAEGDLPLLRRLVTMLAKGRGRPKEAVEALRVEEVGNLEGLGILHVAASRGMLEVCIYLVEELLVDVNCVDKKGRTPLSIAIPCKSVGIAKYLLDHGADPGKVCHDGLSPLHLAAGTGDCETVELLLAKGAHVDLEAFCGTPLHCAATAGHVGTMKILLDHNADYNKMVDGQTPLIAAMQARSQECMWLLMQAGADADEALTYGVKNLQSQKLVSSAFADGMLEDMATNRKIIPDDDEPVAKKKIRAAGFKKLGSLSFRKEEYLYAAGCYSLAMKIDPDDATLYSNRSLCWLLMGDGGKALLDADECRNMRPDWSKACYRQGAALMLLKDYEGASERFLDGLKLDPANTEIKDALRKAYDAMKDGPEHQD
uniref:Uncharacterized protein n=1 Tax=Avena sativa TaxID=4498 RepID=A0ACD5U2M4_AVESA